MRANYLRCEILTAENDDSLHKKKMAAYMGSRSVEHRSVATSVN